MGSTVTVKLTNTQIVGFQHLQNIVSVAVDRRDSFLAECLVEAGHDPKKKWRFEMSSMTFIETPEQKKEDSTKKR